MVKARAMKLWAWAHTHEGRKVIRFTSVSAISTVVSNVVIVIVYGAAHWISNEVYATIFGNLVATLPSYQLNRTWTWGKRGRSHFRSEIVPFWSMSLLGIAFSTILANVVRWQNRLHSVPHVSASAAWPHILTTVLVVFANLISFAIFWVLKLKIFNRIFHVNELAEVDAHLIEEEAQGITTPPA
jgi:putative flippase GtrA